MAFWNSNNVRISGILTFFSNKVMDKVLSIKFDPSAARYTKKPSNLHFQTTDQRALLFFLPPLGNCRY